MRPKERFMAPFLGESTDRPALFYQHLGAGRAVLRSAGVTMEEAMADAGTFARVCEASHELFGFDDLMTLWGDILVEAHAHGTPWTFRRTDDYPRPGEYPLTDPSMVDSITPVDPMDDPHWSVIIEASRALAERRRDMAIVGGVNTPFLVASELRSYEGLILDTMLAPEAVEALLGTVSESLLACVEHLADAGVDAVFLDDATAGRQQNSWELCERFDVRHVKRIVDALHARGVKSIVHNCAAEPYLEEQAELLRPSAMHFAADSVPRGRVEALPRGMVIMPGVDHQRLLYSGKAGAIVEGTEEVLRAYDGERTIMAPACELPLDIDPSNVLLFRDTVTSWRPPSP